MLVTFASEKPQWTETHNTIVLKHGTIMKINANIVPQMTESVKRWPVNLKSLVSWKC